MKLKEALVIFLKGMGIGIAHIIPGLSGGTIAFITGIYERLVQALSKVDFRFILYLLKGDIRQANKNFRNIDFKLFIPLIIGIGLALWLMSGLVLFLLQNFAALTYAFFLGLILASAVLIYKKMEDLSVKNMLFLIAGFLLAFLLFAGPARIEMGHSLPVIFLSGALAICAMILPGISGALVLLFLNQYYYILSVLKEGQFREMFIFGLGALIGILFFSRLVHYLLNKHRALTIFFLVGLMLGSLRIFYQEIATAQEALFPVLISALLGFSLIFILENRFRKSQRVRQ